MRSTPLPGTLLGVLLVCIIQVPHQMIQKALLSGSTVDRPVGRMREFEWIYCVKLDDQHLLPKSKSPDTKTLFIMVNHLLENLKTA